MSFHKRRGFGAAIDSPIVLYSRLMLSGLWDALLRKLNCPRRFENRAYLIPVLQFVDDRHHRVHFLHPFPHRTLLHHDSMASDDEFNPLTLGRSISHQQLTLLFPRSRAVFTPMTSPSIRRNSSFRYSNGLRPDSLRHRNQILLERAQTPAHSWEKFRKSEEELKSIKKKIVRRFYEDQVGTKCDAS
jgi:hypothetical protein